MKPVLLALGLILSAKVSMANAEQVCGATEQVLVALAERYHETVAARAMLADGSLMMVTATSDGSSWSLLHVMPAGTACLLSAGSDWEAMPPSPAGVEG